MFRLRTGCPWRDLPERFGPWQTVWKRHARFSKDGTWDQIMAALLTMADQAGHVDWQLSIDSTISQPGPSARPEHDPGGRCGAPEPHRGTP